jgi:hypothetical protein
MGHVKRNETSESALIGPRVLPKINSASIKFCYFWRPYGHTFHMANTAFTSRDHIFMYWHFTSKKRKDLNMLGEINHICFFLCGCHNSSDDKGKELKILVLFIGWCGMCRSTLQGHILPTVSIKLRFRFWDMMTRELRFVRNVVIRYTISTVSHPRTERTPELAPTKLPLKLFSNSWSKWGLDSVLTVWGCDEYGRCVF